MPENNTLEAHFTAVGKIAAHWALLETLIDMTLWEITSFKDELGACLTAQLMGLGPRLNALGAAVSYFDLSKKLREDLEAFGKKTMGAGEQRNRAVHDPWLLDKETGEQKKIRITAKKALTFKTVTVSIDELHRIDEIIVSLVNEFWVLQERIIWEWLALPREKRGEPPP